MKIGLNFFPVRPDVLTPMARRADELGYESLWLGEHLVFPTWFVNANANDPAPASTKGSTPLFDPLLTLAFIAGQTRRLKIGTGIYVAPLRPPIVTAKLISTLDVLSGGRMLFGLGVGWLRDEFKAVGMPWEHRGGRMEAIHIMRRLWTEDRVAHEGRFYRFDEVAFEPKPVQTPLPIILGGETPVALRRAARIADGWTGLIHTPTSAAAVIRDLQAMGAKDRPFEFTIAAEGGPTADDLRRFRDVGVHRVNLDGRRLAGEAKTLDAMLDGMARFAETVMQKADT